MNSETTSTDIRVEKTDIVKRSYAYALRVIRLYRHLEKDDVGRVLGNQLLKSGTSVGANVHEAQGGQSRADFIAKISIAQKEAKETVYWFRIIQGAKLIDDKRLKGLFDEAEQLVRILSSILITAKKSAKPAVPNV